MMTIKNRYIGSNSIHFQLHITTPSHAFLSPFQLLRFPQAKCSLLHIQMGTDAWINLLSLR